jgi:hypothetical protein
LLTPQVRAENAGCGLRALTLLVPSHFDDFIIAASSAFQQQKQPEHKYLLLTGLMIF